MRPLRRAVFLDRDGVINRMWLDPEHGLVDSPANPEQFQLIEGVPSAIERLRGLGFAVVIVSNQPGIAKGKLTPTLLNAITETMTTELKKGGSSVDGIYYCLHHPAALLPEFRLSCTCRKPRPGLLLKASEDLHLDTVNSYMVGDGLTDVQAGREAGCRTVWVGDWKCDVCRVARERDIRPDFTAVDLTAASAWIEQQERP